MPPNSPPSELMKCTIRHAANPPPELKTASNPAMQDSKKKSAFENWLSEVTAFKTPIKWGNTIAISLYHILAFFGLIKFFSMQTNLWTVLFAFLMGGIGGFGVTAGAHRLWCHRAYKANIPLRIILMLSFGVAGQNTLYDWVRDHRVHHKFSETDADPHNSNRGFFFSHVGWLMMKKHPEVVKKGQQIDMSDILEDPVVQFHMKYFIVLKALLCFILPTLVPVYCWNETWTLSIISQPICRYIFNLNFTWLVNSLAHISGTKPFNRSSKQVSMTNMVNPFITSTSFAASFTKISPVENKTVALLAMGEGWHNYHHSFPWDYKAAELGDYSLNITTMWIDFFAKIGWAYDLRQPSAKLIQRTAALYGDGSHPAMEITDHDINDNHTEGDKY